MQGWDSAIKSFSTRVPLIVQDICMKTPVFFPRHFCPQTFLKVYPLSRRIGSDHVSHGQYELPRPIPILVTYWPHLLDGFKGMGMYVCQFAASF